MLEQQVAHLLETPSPERVHRFFQKITQNLDVEVITDTHGDGKGKRLIATKPILEGSLIFKEPPLVAIQHLRNAPKALVCAQCFCCLGTIQDQLFNALDKRDFHSLSSPSEAEPSTEISSHKQLPCTKDIDEKLPPKIPCDKQCSPHTVYCSVECREAAWSSHHCILCPATYVSTSERALKAFDEFYEHARETNDVFILAAHVVANTVINAARSLKNASSSDLDIDTLLLDIQDVDNCGALADFDAKILEDALYTAWEPYSMGYKALWWECIALPSDVPIEEEEDFRSSLKELALDSLDLLKQAFQHRIPSLYVAFPALFDVRIWGSIIGMFELNNLSLFVGGMLPPWADSVLSILDEEESSGQGPMHTCIRSHPLLTRLSLQCNQDGGGCIEFLNNMVEEEEEWNVDGNAFFSLQSCMNHSCVPNTHAFKREQDINGDAVIIALQDIACGEEITMSYIDADGDVDERQELLKDYGFLCECEKCIAEKLARELL